MQFKIINPKCYYVLFIEVVKFVIKPTLTCKRTSEHSERIVNTFILFIINVLLGITSICIVQFFIGIESENVGIARLHDYYSPLVFVFIMAVVLPLLEETIFRSSLRFKPVNFAFSVGVLTYYLMTDLIFHTYYTDIENQLALRVMVAIGIGGLAFLVSNKYSITLAEFWARHSRLILYSSIISFGLVHILNYDLSLKVVLLAPLITLPQLLSGSVFGFIRTKYGFAYGFLAHSLGNLFASVMILVI